jgi:hypothetical protein
LLALAGGTLGAGLALGTVRAFQLIGGHAHPATRLRDHWLSPVEHSERYSRSVQCAGSNWSADTPSRDSTP